jgi:hypothetical protein
MTRTVTFQLKGKKSQRWFDRFKQRLETSDDKKVVAYALALMDVAMSANDAGFDRLLAQNSKNGEVKVVDVGSVGV